MSTYVLGGGSCDPKLARITLADYKEAGHDLIAVTGNAGWLYPIASDLGIEIHPESVSLEFSSTDTVISPLDQDGLEDILKTGAVVLDLTDGLVPLELTDEPGEIPEVPDVPDVLPEAPKAEEPADEAVPAPVEDKPNRAPRQRKKPVVDPLPDPAKPVADEETTVKIPTSIVEDVSTIGPADGYETPSAREVRLVRQLVQLHTENADLDTLYVVLDLLRGKGQ